MMEVLSKITISEVILLFIILFLLPELALIILRLRKYETLFGDLPEEKKKGRKKKKKGEAEAEAPPEPEAPDLSGAYPYASRSFMTSAHWSALDAMREAYGEDVEVFPKVALWETVESTNPEQTFHDRLHDKDYDFLICDRKTGQPLTAIMFNPAKGQPAGAVDELRKICQAAGANVVFIDMIDNYTAETMKEALGIPDLDL